MDNMAIWSKFTESGKVEDYLMYKKSLHNRLPQYEDETEDEDEYGRLDTQRTKYW